MVADSTLSLSTDEAPYSTKLTTSTGIVDLILPEPVIQMHHGHPTLGSSTSTSQQHNSRGDHGLLATSTPWYHDLEYTPRVREYFDNENVKYMCCRNHLHIRSAAYLVCACELLLLGLRSLDLVYVALNGLCLRLLWNSCELAVWVFVLLLMLAALRCQSHSMLVPHIAVQISYTMLLLSLLLLTCLYCLFDAGDEIVVFLVGQHIDDRQQNALLLTAFVLLLGSTLVVNSFFLSITLRAYNYFVDYDAYMSEN